MATIAIALSIFIFVAAGFVACTCPGFFVAMGLCAVFAFWVGSRMQRVIACALLLVAIACAISEFRAEFLWKHQMQKRQEIIRRYKEPENVPEKTE